MGFNKRTYGSPKEFFKDLLFPVRNRKKLREANRKGLLSPAFRERLMLAVVSVEGCRYCSYLHSKLALRGGVQADEIRQLLSGEFDECPEDEVTAILYAQHWAESNARSDIEASRRLVEQYGAEKANAIHLMLRMIRLGNLLGNTWDYFLYRLTFGKCRR